MRLNEIQLGKSVKYNFYDIFALVQARPDRPGLTIRQRRDRPPESKKSGIYVWYHPDWGFFYVGIAAADNFTERWNKHIQKLLDQCTTAKQMRNWREFATKFKNAGYGIDDLKNITLRFFPITTVKDFGNKEQLKQELKAIETRIVKMINPACNFEYDPSRPSATKFPTSRPEQTLEYVNPETVEQGFEKTKYLMGKYRMVAKAREPVEGKTGTYGLIITVHDDTQPFWSDVAKARFIVTNKGDTIDPDNDHMEVSMVQVDTAYQRQGLASAMYQFARELGNEIKPSRAQTPSGKAFWAAGAGVGRNFPEQPIVKK